MGPNQMPARHAETDSGGCPAARWLRRATTISVMSSGNPSAPPATEPVSSLYDTRLPQLSRWRRMQIPVIAAAVIADHSRARSHAAF